MAEKPVKKATVISIINNKGGTGKTTTVMNLAAALGRKGKNVLAIDLDSQCNLSSSSGVAKPEKHIGHILLGECTVNEAITPTEDMALLPSTPKLLDYEYRVSSEPGREYILREALEQVTGRFDYILVDCAPSLGTLAINSLVAADAYIVPMQAENFAYIGLDKILQTADKVKKRMNPGLALAGIILVKHSPRTRFSQAVTDNLQNNTRLKGKLFSTYIRQDIALMESSAFGQSIYEYAPKSRGAEDYRALAKQIIEHYG
jgi:chromosome partitioning protein